MIKPEIIKHKGCFVMSKDKTFSPINCLHGDSYCPSCKKVFQDSNTLAAHYDKECNPFVYFNTCVSS